MRYVDGFLIPIPKKHLRTYQRIAQKAGKVWKKLGALEYCETVGDDLAIRQVIPFPKRVKVKRGETVVFSWIVYRSKAHRDQVNARVMKHPDIVKMMTQPSPFELKRMSYGGFRMLVDM
jgi:alkaline phosphatase